jgi:hypothetical protein
MPNLRRDWLDPQILRTHHVSIIPILAIMRRLPARIGLPQPLQIGDQRLDRLAGVAAESDCGLGVDDMWKNVSQHCAALRS